MSFWRRGGWGRADGWGTVFSWDHLQAMEMRLKNCGRTLTQFFAQGSSQCPVRLAPEKHLSRLPPAPSLPPWFRILLPFLRRLCNAGMKDGGGEFGWRISVKAVSPVDGGIVREGRVSAVLFVEEERINEYEVG